MPNELEIDGTAPTAAAGPSPEDDARLLEYLRERDEPCPRCEYNLRNLVHPYCPECGELLKLRVTLAEVYLKAWVTAVGSMCAGAGLGLLWTFVLIVAGNPPPEWMPTVFMQMAMIPVAVFLLARRKMFLRKSRKWQWTFAWIALAAFAISMGLILLAVD